MFYCQTFSALRAAVHVCARRSCNICHHNTLLYFLHLYATFYLNTIIWALLEFVCLAAKWKSNTWQVTSVSLSSLTLISLTHQGVFQCCHDDFIHIFISFTFEGWTRTIWLDSRLWAELPLALLIKCVSTILSLLVLPPLVPSQSRLLAGTSVLRACLSVCLPSGGAAGVMAAVVQIR